MLLTNVEAGSTHDSFILSVSSEGRDPQAGALPDGWCLIFVTQL